MDLSKYVGFDWDKHNTGKNWDKHRVSPQECEQVLFNKPLKIGWDETHSSHEARYYAFGQTDEGRRLFMIFTMRVNRIRVISARPMNKNERRAYELYQKETS